MHAFAWSALHCRMICSCACKNAARTLDSTESASVHFRNNDEVIPAATTARPAATTAAAAKTAATTIPNTEAAAAWAAIDKASADAAAPAEAIAAC